MDYSEHDLYNPRRHQRSLLPTEIIGLPRPKLRATQPHVVGSRKKRISNLCRRNYPPLCKIVTRTRKQKYRYLFLPSDRFKNWMYAFYCLLEKKNNQNFHCSTAKTIYFESMFKIFFHQKNHLLGVFKLETMRKAKRRQFLPIYIAYFIRVYKIDCLFYEPWRKTKNEGYQFFMRILSRSPYFRRFGYRKIRKLN